MTIRSVQLQHFRGIIGPLSLDLTVREVVESAPLGGPVPPVLLYGANGSGKSSICDALEFGARGVVSRRGAGGAKSRREVRNLISGDVPYVKVEFSDDSSITRGYGPTPGTRLKGAVPGFEHGPFVVRRSAVEGFWLVSSEQRLDTFWDYLKPPDKEWRSVDDQLAIQRHAEAVAARKKSGEEVQKHLIPATHKVPRTNLPFILPTTATPKVPRILERAALEVKRERGARPKLDAKDRALIRDYLDCLQAELEVRDGASLGAEKLERTYQPLSEVFAAAAQAIAADFSSIAEQSWINTVRIEVADDARLRVELVGHGGEVFEPEMVLSEAYLDLLALLILIEVQVQCAERGQRRVLVLDDVFQSVDAPLRQRTLRHLCQRLAGWQIVLTVHDRLWLELAERVFREEKWPRARVLELRHGGAGRTPVLLHTSPGLMRDVAFVAEHGGSAVLLAGAAGRALEAIYDRLTVSLGCKVVRKSPENYMIRDLEPPVSSMLENCASPRIRELSRLLKRAQFLRNAVGSHFNEHAEGISDSEVEDAASIVTEFFALVACQTCGTFMSKGENTSGKWAPAFSCKHDPNAAP